MRGQSGIQEDEEEFVTAAALTNQNASTPREGKAFDAPPPAKGGLKRQRDASPKQRVRFDTRGDAPQTAFLPTPGASQEPRDVAVRLLGVCFNHAYGCRCKNHENGACS